MKNRITNSTQNRFFAGAWGLIAVLFSVMICLCFQNGYRDLQQKSEGALETETTDGKLETLLDTWSSAQKRENTADGNRITDAFEENSAPTAQSKPIPDNEKIIYLTFDDGPGSYTGKLLDILARYNAKATFFVTNSGYINEITRAVQEGHTVAMHTVSHRFEDIYASEEAFFADLYQMQGIITSLTGQTPMLLRFPGGSSNTISKNYNKGIMSRLAQAVQAQGFQYFDWNVDSNDAGGATTSDQVFANVVAGIGNKQAAVVLQHDVKDFSVNAVERILVWGISKGYHFRALTPDSPGCHHEILN